MTSQSFSYQDWYEEHAESLSEKRKRRYREDPEYRQKVLEANRINREKKMVQRTEPRLRVRLPRMRKPVNVSVSGEDGSVTKAMVHIGMFSRAIGRSVSTIHQWERKGIIPKTPYCANNERKERLYTMEMVGAVKTAIDRRGNVVSNSDQTFCAEILQEWAALGVRPDEQQDVTGE